MLDTFFRLNENDTNVRTELVAGATTFLTMAYIALVNPQILAAAGMDKGAVFVATCLASALATLFMALYANYPLAWRRAWGSTPISPMASCSACYSCRWRSALFSSGCLFLVLSVSRVRSGSSM